MRFFHWSLVACFAGAWLTTVGSATLHQVFGYATLALVAAPTVVSQAPQSATRLQWKNRTKRSQTRTVEPGRPREL